MSRSPARTNAPLEASSRLRLDAALLARELSPSRAKAQEAIAAGLVMVDGVVVRKAATMVPAEATLEAVPPYPWVSRGGVKLAAALDHFHLDPSGQVALDVGASTGGFTDVLLARGAIHVHAVDVGRGQLHPRLVAHSRVSDHSATDIRSLAPGDLQPEPSVVVCDASFIALHQVLLPALALARSPGFLVALIKPQFEVGRGGTVKGIVRDSAARKAACDGVVALLQRAELEVAGVIPSPITGGDGNMEFLVAAYRR